MNKDLLKEIVKHIYSNFGIIASDFINNNKTKALISKDFLLNEQISFLDENDLTLKNDIWGCQISADKQEIKILLADCSQDENKEYSLFIQMKDAPAYGIYYLPEPLIACSLNGKEWMNCNTFLQSTFLVAMEQVKELNLSWSKCINFKDQLSMFKNFINYYNESLNDN